MPRVDPHSYADPDQGRVREAHLRVLLDFEQRRLHGEVTLTLDRPAGGAIDLDTRDLAVERVTSDGAELSWYLGQRDPVMGSRLRIELPAGADSVTIAYATSPKATALQWLEPRHTAGGRYPYLFSQCQPHHARAVLPIQDTASVRFAYRAEVMVPEPLVAVMSAAPGACQAGPEEGLRTWFFEMPQPIPAYLLAIAAGELEGRDLGRRCRIYSEPAVIDAAAWEFAGVEEMLAAAEELFGPYRWDRYDFVVMPPAFPYGGMENPRLTFLTPTLIAGDRSLVNVLAHELAHSWTGNLVTNATMNDFWLNEGFTVWAERRLLERLEGPDAVALAAAMGRTGLEAELERFGASSPFTCLKLDLENVDPDEVYSQVPYEKGFLFVTLLERIAGRGRFDAFMREYIDRFAFTSISTEQFVEHLRDRLPGVAEAAGAERWLYGPGIPHNAPMFHSRRLTELRALATAWMQGVRPAPDLARRWSVNEWLLFLNELPNRLSSEECAWLDRGFGLTRSKNTEILCRWLLMAAAAGYEPVYPRIRSFLASAGRMKYLKPLYKTLMQSERTRRMAREIFAANADCYHPIARVGLEAILRDG